MFVNIPNSIFVGRPNIDQLSTRLIFNTMEKLERVSARLQTHF